MRSRQAFIDLGTNTFHLLIADLENLEAKITFQTKEIVGLGAGGINDNLVSAEAQFRGLKTLESFKKIIVDQKCDRVDAFGTSALRNASNSSDFLRRVKESTGIAISIIDGNREAELIYEGIKGDAPATEFPNLIMDIGGGSTEFILADGEKILWQRSFEVGVQRLLPIYLTGNPPELKKLQQLYEYLETFLYDLDHLKSYDIKNLIGASGTYTTLQRMHLEVPKKDSLDDGFVPTSAFNKYYQQIISLSREERQKIPGMSEPRVDLIVMGAALVNFVLIKFELNGFFVSDKGLKEGAMQLAAKGKL